MQFDDNSDMFIYLINKHIEKFQSLSTKKQSSIKIYQSEIVIEIVNIEYGCGNTSFNFIILFRYQFRFFFIN